MADLTGICQWSDSRRVTLLLEFMGRPVTPTVDRERVEAMPGGTLGRK